MNGPLFGKKCNIILINCDDLGYGDLGCYGSEVNKTPGLDKMAREGMRFTDFYMASSVCSPSRGSMMTGCYPQRIGFGEFHGRPVLSPGQPLGLHPHEITIAKILKSRGYATKLVGKWHCGDQPDFLPTRHGFDSYFGLPYSNDMARRKSRPDLPPLPLMRDESVVQEQPDQAALTERYVEEAISFIRDHRDCPFFLYFAHMYVHVPIYVNDRFKESSRNGLYGAAVEYIDWSTQAILHEVTKLGLEKETLVVFTSDNGGVLRVGGSNHPLRGGKATTWEGGQRVPCIMRWPGTIPAGQVCKEIITAMDFLPTFAVMGGCDLPRDRIIDGKDISDIITGVKGARSPHSTFFYYLKNDLEAVRAGKWKLHLKSGELYDLESDIGETTNIAHQNPTIIKELNGKARECRGDLGDAWMGVTGTRCRQIGRVPHPKFLTRYDETAPYMVALYD